MEMNNFFGICVIFTVSLMVFCLCVNVFVGFQIFGNAGVFGPDISGNSSQMFTNFTKNPDFPVGMTMGMIWGLVLTSAAAVGLVLAWIMQDASILGVFIFSGVFWSSFINAMVILGAMAFIPVVLIGLFTVPVLFIFVAAVIGMLSGS
jgi:hypothetical protein